MDYLTLLAKLSEPSLVAIVLVYLFTQRKNGNSIANKVEDVKDILKLQNALLDSHGKVIDANCKNINQIYAVCPILDENKKNESIL